MWRVQNTGMQHIGLLELSRVDGSTCNQWACIDTPFFLSNHPCAPYLATVLMCRVGNVTRAGFVVFAIHTLAADTVSALAFLSWFERIILLGDTLSIFFGKAQLQLFHALIIPLIHGFERPTVNQARDKPYTV